MSLKQEQMILRGRLEELRMEKMDLAARAEANIRAAKGLLAAASVTPLAEIDLAGAAVHITEAADLQKRYVEVCGKMAAIEKELS